MSEALQRSKTIIRVQKETTGRRVAVVPGIVVGNPRAGSFTESLHLCGGVRCDVLRKEDFLDLPVDAGPLGAFPGRRSGSTTKAAVIIIYLQFSQF